MNGSVLAVFSKWICLICSVDTAAQAAPNVLFPSNSQVPTVARVNEPYQFQLSNSTFAPTTSNFTYQISGQLSWLQLNGQSQTLTGTPGPSDAGSVHFVLTAASEAGQAYMVCTLVESADPAPLIEGDISQPLKESANLSSTHPPVVALEPLNVLDFHFQQSSFIDIVQRKLYCYATLSDHTPLPSWLQFNPESLSFSGTAPALSTPPQSWDIDLIVSDVQGFGGTTARFAIALGAKKTDILYFTTQLHHPSEHEFYHRYAAASTFPQWHSNWPGKPHEGNSFLVAQLVEFQENLLIEGVVPAMPSNQSFSVTVADGDGDLASVDINLNTGEVQLISGAIGRLEASEGQTFDYQFPASFFSEPDTVLDVDIPATRNWLHFKPRLRQLQGVVPTQAAPSRMTATLLAWSPASGTEQSQAFEIGIKPTATRILSTSRLASHASPINTFVSTASTVATSAPTRPHMSPRAIAVIAALSVVVAALLALCLFLCWRRKRRKRTKSLSSRSFRDISYPIVIQSSSPISTPPHVAKDIEKGEAADVEYQLSFPRRDHPPQIELDLPPRPDGRKSK
ncbi:hypothetical protein K470DRAFT_261572 [Piedraia hortae CBS 480.64]|uniref:Dystroglycan-type cadherin-like domain-containing protein n=1 Tax=Piedraia hortae CBS 480.64 TaxID=1314780 RepID=A0A6A7CA01_9PEZI|nr:hypothetical protein K470DRAFT_261572 [Piedraia hortae CBS 480.64]